MSGEAQSPVLMSCAGGVLTSLGSPRDAGNTVMQTVPGNNYAL
jgi:hypothetical protein